MADYAKLITQAEKLIQRLERLVPQDSPPPDWGVSAAFRWRKRNGRGWIQPVTHIHHIGLEDLQGIEQQKRLVETNTRQFVQGIPANNVLLTGARGTGNRPW